MKSLLVGLLLAPSCVVAVGVASPAAALSCVGPEIVLRDAAAIYTGRIVESSDDEVTVAIDEVWRGTPPPARVTYDVDLPQWWELDRVEERGGRMVFAPTDGAVNPCTVFALSGETADAVRAFRPASPAAPAAARQEIDRGFGVAEVDHTWAWIAGGVGGGALLGACAWWVLRRRRA